MKNMTMVLVLATVTLAAVSCGPKKTAPKEEEKEPLKALVLYYSQTSNTKLVAEEIANRLGADIEEIVAVDPYDPDFKASIERCMKEREAGILPEIEPLKADLAQYDVVFFGFPVWFGTYAPPMITLVNEVDFSGKKLVPFCTFGSGGLESSVKDLEAAEPNAEILPGYGVRAARLEAVPQEIDQFLKAGGFLEGDFVKLADFPEQHPVTDEEAAVFNAATGDYPMMNAQAKTVASREIPGGVEYVFTAEDLPREGAPDMPPPGGLTVYVTVLEGQAPVFTRVVR